jgi:hypothetical protein
MYIKARPVRSGLVDPDHEKNLHDPCAVYKLFSLKVDKFVVDFIKSFANPAGFLLVLFLGPDPNGILNK